VRVVGRGAICEPEPDAIDNEREHSFSVSEFTLLDNGERVAMVGHAAPRFDTCSRRARGATPED
jgi:hypothetical protein